MAHISNDLLADDIDAYLDQHEHKSMLRFITCGSVDDGKSTLIGRLLYDSKLVFEDHLAALESDSKKVGTQGGELDFALLVDGLAAEREQGITIDVAYRFFSTEHRKFIVADTPGHEQYTRNMVTGASTADLAVILIDARKGVLTQTRRHTLPRVAARHPPRGAGHQQARPRRLLARRSSTRSRPTTGPSPPRSASTTSSASRCPRSAATTSPSRRENTPWYDGPTLIGHLETVEIDDEQHARPVPHAGAVGEPPQPRLPRLLRRDRRRLGAARRRRPGRAVRAVSPPSSASSPWTATSPRPWPASRSPSPSPTRSTSPAATSSPPPTSPARRRRPVRVPPRVDGRAAHAARAART